MARRREPRGLRPDELELWRRIERSATPLRPAATRMPGPREAEGPVPARSPREAFEIEAFRVGSAARPQSPAPARPSAHLPPRMDAKAFGRMKRGKLAVEGRIDLHGLTLDRAHPRLERFVHDAHASGKRLVLVITGKGRELPDDGPIPQRRGILRRQVPVWLASGALGPIVLQVSEAHRSHGGGGAFYVYLRRRGQ